MPEAIKGRYKSVPYFDNNMRDAYIASDVIVGRAGAGSISEVAGFKKQSILIPLPESAQDHQKLNAFEYESMGAGYMIEEENLLPNLFLEKLISILGDPKRYESMSQSAARFFKPDAASNLAKILLECRDGSRIAK